MTAPVDLRSDTVTRPTAAMRQAMASAEVGDDVYGEDPTVTQLEERVAELLGTEAALFVPTGTMANQIALRAQTRPGDEVIIGAGAHCWRHESGALAALAGAADAGDRQRRHVHRGRGARRVQGRRSVSGARRAWSRSRTRTTCGGGIVWDRAQLAGGHRGRARARHGARTSTARACGTRRSRPARASSELAAGFDSVSVCLSKGLGAPVGSVVAGTQATSSSAAIALRKMYGGGMRQAGILAAAGLYALEHHRARLADDHANARALAEALAGATQRRASIRRACRPTS